MDVPVWDIKGCNDAGPTVVLTHGWGDSRVVSLCRAPVLLAHCRRLILWDMPGHGEAPGRCSLGKHEGADLAALVEAIGREGPAPILYGHSLGAGISIEAGAALGPERVAGVIAEAPYRRSMTPARNVMRLAHLPYRLNLPLAMLTIRPGFDRAEQAARLRVPLLVLHGDADLVCPVADGSEIAAARPGARLVIVPDGGHLDLFTDARFLPTVAAAVASFLDSAPRLSAPSEAVEGPGTHEIGAPGGSAPSGQDPAR
jgi:pimeloyl-ACP methyl ester carboxylesterase